jgi:hypothetical protein
MLRLEIDHATESLFRKLMLVHKAKGMPEVDQRRLVVDFAPP